MENSEIQFILKEKELNKLVDFLMQKIHKGARIILLEGDLGAGKTRLTQDLIKQLTPDAVVQSPTFVIEKIYIPQDYSDIELIHHLDLYRLKFYSEFIDLGFSDIINNKKHLFIIEWPKLIENKINHYLKINIKDIQNGKAREYSITEK